MHYVKGEMLPNMRCLKEKDSLFQILGVGKPYNVKELFLNSNNKSGSTWYRYIISLDTDVDGEKNNTGLHLCCSSKVTTENI